MNYKPQYILVHHSAAEAPLPQFDAINEWHKARDFAISDSGLYVGYHRVIEKNGDVRIARQDGERDCDALGHNFDSLSVCLVGNFDIVDPTPLQVAELGRLLSQWCTAYSLTAHDIHPHRFFANKSCYGSRLPDNWAALVYLKYELGRIQGLIEQLLAEQNK